MMMNIEFILKFVIKFVWKDRYYKNHLKSGTHTNNIHKREHLKEFN